jgi:hypothetical protein
LYHLTLVGIVLYLQIHIPGLAYPVKNKGLSILGNSKVAVKNKQQIPVIPPRKAL